MCLFKIYWYLSWIYRFAKLFLYLQNVHQGYLTETLVRFLKAREGNVAKAHKMVRYVSFGWNIRESVAVLYYWNSLILISPFYWWHVVPVMMFQLVDCLNWRVQNEIDNILAVSLHSALVLLFSVSWLFVYRLLISDCGFKSNRVCNLPMKKKKKFWLFSQRHVLLTNYFPKIFD